MAKKEIGLIDEYLNAADEYLTNADKVDKIIKDFTAQSKIEKVKEEKYIVDSLIKGIKIKTMCNELEVKHPGTRFYPEDISIFLERNREIVRNLEKNKNILTRRHLNAVTQIEEEMGGLYLFTKKLLKKFDAEGDNTATLGAVNSLNKTLINFAKLKGFGAFAPREATNTNIEINVGEKRNAKTLEANFKIIDIEDDKISEEQEADSGKLQERSIKTEVNPTE